MHAGAAVQASRVGAGALHRAKGPSRPLLLHQLANYCLHRLCGLSKIYFSQHLEVQVPHRNLKLTVQVRLLFAED